MLVDAIRQTESTSVALLCFYILLELCYTLKEGSHTSIKLGVPQEAKAPRPIERQFTVLSHHLMQSMNE